MEAEENASKFGTALGLAIGVIGAAVEDTEDIATEENDEPTMKM